jgi:hypothetical protein
VLRDQSLAGALQMSGENEQEQTESTEGFLNLVIPVPVTEPPRGHRVRRVKISRFEFLSPRTPRLGGEFFDVKDSTLPVFRFFNFHLKAERIVMNKTMLAAFSFLLMFAQAYAQTDPLPSWNDGPSKKAIVEFVKTTTDKTSPKFVAPEARIATFDQDGALWVEQPMYRRTN